MSWLLVAFVPALLMLATFGLSRLEAGLVGDTVTQADVAEFLEQAEAAEMRTLARTGLPEALDLMHRRRTERIVDTPAVEPNSAKHRPDPNVSVPFAVTVQPGMPSGRHKHSRANPQFTATRPINRV